VLLSDSARGGMTRCYAGGLGSRPNGQHSACVRGLQKVIVQENAVSPNPEPRKGPTP